MRAMILAAGRGARMGALTDQTPKPLIKLGKHLLIEYPLLALVKMGITDIVINTCYRSEQIKSALGTGSRYGVDIQYSEESEALETGGGIFQALPLLGKDPFIALSCDIVSDYPLAKLPKEPSGLAHLVLVDNPSYHPNGDFCLQDQRVYCGTQPKLTFSNIGVYRPELFNNCQSGKFRLGHLLQEASAKSQVSGEYYQGLWHNIGTEQDIQSFLAISR